jgi:thymidylate synthase ThyX
VILDYAWIICFQKLDSELISLPSKYSGLFLHKIVHKYSEYYKLLNHNIYIKFLTYYFSFFFDEFYTISRDYIKLCLSLNMFVGYKVDRWLLILGSLPTIATTKTIIINCNQ